MSDPGAHPGPPDGGLPEGVPEEYADAYRAAYEEAMAAFAPPAPAPAPVREPKPAKPAREPKPVKVREPKPPKPAKPAREPKPVKVREPKPAREPKPVKVREPKPPRPAKPTREPKPVKVREPKPPKPPKPARQRRPATARPAPRPGGEQVPVLPVLGLLAGLGLVLAAVALRAPEQFGLVIALAGVGLVAVLLGLWSPVIAMAYLLLTTFFRLAIPSVPPTDPFFLATIGLLLSSALWARRHHLRPRAPGLLEAVIGLYLLVNLVSYLSPHVLPASYPAIGVPIPVGRFIIIGVALPLLALLVARFSLSHRKGLRGLTFAVLFFGAYSAAVSVLAIHGPQALVWPRYVLANDEWPGRAVGVVNQPVVNGLVLVLGYLAALFVASHRGEARWIRVGSGLLAAACAYGVYLTFTRSAWLSLGIVVVLGLLLARGWRTGFALTLGAAVVGIAANWATFSSSDRSAGGVASSNELEDRLNVIATAVWGIREEPFTGWGIGRFPALNTFHHEGMPGVPWERGFAIASHLDPLGITAELGLLGGALYLALHVVVLVRLARAVRRLPADDLYGRPFAVLALLSYLSLLVTGLTVDLRFFDFSNIIIMLLAGAAIGRVEPPRRVSPPARTAPRETVGPDAEPRLVGSPS